MAAKWARSGLHGITVEEEDGGLGLGYLEHVVAQEEVARASASIGLSYGAHSNLCVNQIRRWANAGAEGEISAQADLAASMSARSPCREAGAGSDVVGMKLQGRGGAGRATSSTAPNSGSPTRTHADTLVVYAKTGEEGSRGITTFLIEKDMEGFSIGQKLDKMGMRGSPTAELVFDDCEVPGRECDGPGEWRRRRADVRARLRADRARRHPARASCRPASTWSCPMSASASSSASRSAASS